MPNWTSNTIRAQGDEADLRTFLNAVKWQDQIFDFNRLIPMPELVRHAFHGSRVVEGQRVNAWYQINLKDVSFDPKDVRLFTPEEQAALRDIGYKSWYDWSIAKWGTKWNAVGAKLDDRAIARGVIEIDFDTAWAAPMPIFHKLFELFPHVSFECEWRDEGHEHLSSISHNPNVEGDAS